MSPVTSYVTNVSLHDPGILADAQLYIHNLLSPWSRCWVHGDLARIDEDALLVPSAAATT